MIKPKLNNDHNLKSVVDVLDLVSFVTAKIILYLLSLNIMKFTYLIKCVWRYFFKSFRMLLRRQQFQLIVHIS